MTVQQIAGGTLIVGLGTFAGIGLWHLLVPEARSWWRQVRARRLSVDDHMVRALNSQASNVRVLPSEKRRAL